MPIALSIDDFLEAIRKSGAVDPRRLDAFLQSKRESGELPDDPTQLAEVLVGSGYLTKFQAELLLQGKSRRFLISNRYKLLDRLGSGGMASVFLCEHRIMKRRVAIKVLPPKMAADPKALERFHREARACAALDHPNIVRAYDVDQDGQMHFLVIEYIDGTNLNDIVKNHGPLSMERAAHYISQAAAGLQYVHERGLVHRDIKPANLLLDRSGTIKILDLGLARFFNDQDDNLTKEHESKVVLGTIDYMAPEQGVDSHAVDIRADIYSLGMTLYFLLTGTTPFAHGTVQQKLVWLHMAKPKSVREFRPEIPEELDAVINKMLEKKPEDRYQTPREVMEALAPWTATPIPPPSEEEMPKPLVLVGSDGNESNSVAMSMSMPTPLDLQPGTSRIQPKPAPGAGSGSSTSVRPQPAGSSTNIRRAEDPTVETPTPRANPTLNIRTGRASGTMPPVTAANRPATPSNASGTFRPGAATAITSKSSVGMGGPSSTTAKTEVLEAEVVEAEVVQPGAKSAKDAATLAKEEAEKKAKRKAKKKAADLANKQTAVLVGVLAILAIVFVLVMSTGGEKKKQPNEEVAVAANTPVWTPPPKTQQQPPAPQPKAPPRQAPPPYEHHDIGNPKLKGGLDLKSKGNTWIAFGSGKDIWEQQDQFHYISQPFRGDGGIRLRINSLKNNHPWVKAGGMFRASLDADSPYAAILLTGGEGVLFQWRSSKGAKTEQQILQGAKAPIVLRLTRVGNSFTAYTSINQGQDWVRIGNPVEINMPSELRAGIAVTSHDINQLTEAHCDAPIISAEVRPIDPQVVMQPKKDPEPPKKDPEPTKKDPQPQPPAEQVVTDEFFYPRTAGQYILYDAAVFNPAINAWNVERLRVHFKDDSKAEVTSMRTGRISGSTLLEGAVPAWLPSKEVRRPMMHFRKTDGFWEIGNPFGFPGNNLKPLWLAELKLGVKAGDNWKAPLPNGLQKSCTVEKIDDHKGRPAVTIKETVSLPGGDQVIESIWVKGVGLVEKRITNHPRADPAAPSPGAPPVPIFQLKLVEDK